MKHILAVCLLAALAVPTAFAEGANPKVALDTTKGQIVIELFAEEAPGTVKNFLSYVESGFFVDTIFHRVIPGFMAQGGGFTADLKKKPTEAPIQNEANNGVRNERGTLAMARTGDPHSATAQFFINVVDNASLDHTSETPRGWGYAVFGKVVEGMDVVDAIVAEPTTRRGMQANLPVETITIEGAAVVGVKE